MSTNAQDPVREMAEDECWTRLSEVQLGRIVVFVDDEIDIFPVNYVVSDGMIYFRTSPGGKLVKLTINSSVVFEVDNSSTEQGWAWSIIVRGIARNLVSPNEIVEADKLGLTPWTATVKYEYVEIAPTRMSGRYFALGPEPSRY
jgi:nitroimidazol reductase NimA-like FMN-containing flavoprotein (pyridoxamine 5'-phosphate oxidase superfamily)